MTVQILVGDSLAMLKTQPDASVHTCVTSPPYYGLRDYGVDGQIGLEKTPQEFIDKLVAVFREVRRVLRDDGTAWVNMGDSYASGGRASRDPGQSKIHPAFEGDLFADGLRPADPPGIKPKDLMGIPWMLAFALRADGWYLRQDIIWHKPNPMPESVTDRCTKAHEYIFLLSKSERYYYDNEAVKEPCNWDASNTKMPDGWDTGEGAHGSIHRNGREKGARVHIPGNKSHKGTTAYLEGDELQRTKAGLVDYVTRQRSARDSFKRDDSKRAEVIPGQSVGTHRPDREESEWDISTRNKRSVWTVATQPFKEAHFATFPPALIEPCILAGCPAGGMVLDPFFGAGTIGLVADRLQRNCIGVELNPQYAAMARKRINGDSPLFAAAQ